ncbi:MAG: Gfo/Idh/MocA family oxidoreductase [Planctomycetota bacterium]
MNILVVGCGDLGTQHANAWAMRSDAKVVAVCDPDADRAKRLAEVHAAKPYADWREAVAHEGLFAVSVCTPAYLHAPISIACAELQRNVLCEKAMALKLNEADAMIKAFEANGVRLVISHQLRGVGRFVAIKRLIDECVLGSPLFIRFTDVREVRPKLAMHRRSMNGGPIHDMAGHFFDLARWFTGAEAETVAASGHVFGPGKPRLASIDEEDLGVDAAEILVRYSGGHTLSVNINWGMPESMPGLSAQDVVCGPKGLVRFDHSQTQLILHDSDGEREISIPENPVGPTVRIKDLVQAARNNSRPEVDGHAGRSALNLILRTLESVRTQKTVEVV